MLFFLETPTIIRYGITIIVSIKTEIIGSPIKKIDHTIWWISLLWIFEMKGSRLIKTDLFLLGILLNPCIRFSNPLKYKSMELGLLNFIIENFAIFSNHFLDCKSGFIIISGLLSHFFPIIIIQFCQEFIYTFFWRRYQDSINSVFY